MFFLLGGNNKKTKAKNNKQTDPNIARVREFFNSGRFPVVTTDEIDEDRKIGKVLGLVACRGFDSDDAFFGMANRAINQGAQAIIGYKEQISFHPDGSKYFSCYGTAIQFAVDPDKVEQLQIAHYMQQALSAKV